MNRTALCSTLLLHCVLLLMLRVGAAMQGTDRAPAAVEARTHTSIGVRLIARNPARDAAASLRRQSLPLQLHAPVLPGISLPHAWGAQELPASPADIPAPTLAGDAQLAAPPPAALVARAPLAAAPAALVPVTLPPEHQACNDRQVARHYPALLRDRGIEGRVVVRVKVDEDGRAAEVLVQGPSGWRLLDEAARQVAAACPYVAARRGDERLVAWIEYPVRFSLH